MEYVTWMNEQIVIFTLEMKFCCFSCLTINFPSFFLFWMNLTELQKKWMKTNEKNKRNKSSSMENEYSSQWRSTINFSGGGQQSVKLYYAVHASRLSTVKTLQLVIYIAGLRIEGRPVREEGTHWWWWWWWGGGGHTNQQPPPSSSSSSDGYVKVPRKKRTKGLYPIGPFWHRVRAGLVDWSKSKSTAGFLTRTCDK
jgi:hypothetical protein